MEGNIRLEVKDKVGYIILNKQPLNILSIEDLEYILELLKKINEDKSIKIVVFKTGLKDFSAGVNINEHTIENIIPILDLLKKISISILEVKCPIVSFVKGYCLGGGMEIVLLSDIILATKSAKFGQPEIKLAHMAPLGITLLPEIVGAKKASQMILTGKIFSADEAIKINMISEVFDDAEFEDKSEQFINEMLEYSQAALLANTLALRQSLIDKIEFAQDAINDIYLDELIPHNDATEGLKAFMEKRKPIWSY